MTRPRLLPTILGRAIWRLLIFDSTINLLTVVLLDPLLVLLLERIVSLGGDPFVGNTALVAFALSPAGMASFAIAGISVFLVNILALGGESLILWEARQGLPVSQLAIWNFLIRRLPSLLTISIFAFGVSLLILEHFSS